MINYQRLKGVALQPMGLPSLTVTAEGEALGFIPGWRCFIDPDYDVSNGIRNRAMPKNTLPSASGVVAFSTIAGETAVQMPSNINNRLIPNFTVNPTEFTFFTVLQGSDLSGSGGFEVVRENNVAHSGYAPRFVINSSGAFSVYSGNTVLRLAEATALPLNEPVLVMVTFSTTDGLKILRNGAVTAAAPADLNPLNSQYTAGQFSIFRQSPSSGAAPALFGMTGFFDIDLSTLENSGYKKALELFMAEKYGITIA